MTFSLLKFDDESPSMSARQIAMNRLTMQGGGATFVVVAVDDSIDVACAVSQDTDRVSAVNAVKHALGPFKGDGGGTPKIASGRMQRPELVWSMIVTATAYFRNYLEASE